MKRSILATLAVLIAVFLADMQKRQLEEQYLRSSTTEQLGQLRPTQDLGDGARGQFGARPQEQRVHRREPVRGALLTRATGASRS